MLFFKKLVFLIKFLPIDIILFLKGIKVEVAKDAEYLGKIFKLMKKALNLSFQNKINHWAFFMIKGLCDSFKKMGVNFAEIKTFPDTEKEIANKSKMSGYFKQDIWPYFLDLRKMI